LVFAILMFGAVPYSISAAISGVLLGVGRPDYSLKIAAVVLVVNTLAGLVLIPHFGAIGSAVSLAVTSLVSGGQVLFIISRRVGLQLKLRRLGIALLLMGFVVIPQMLLSSGVTRTIIGIVGILGSIVVLCLAKLLNWQDIRAVANMLQLRSTTLLWAKRGGRDSE
jgi:O-antigen/teichoic acid export membrane protein